MTNSQVRGHKSVNAESTDAKVTNYHVSLRAQVISADSSGRLHQIGWQGVTRRLPLLRSRQDSSWDRRSSVGLEKVTAAVLAAAAVRPGCQVLDIGCGSGQLSLLLADLGARVLAIDPSKLMIGQLENRARERGPIGLECLATPIERLSLPAESVDLIVTCYALHNLRDVDKS